MHLEATGYVAAVRGGVVDVTFGEGALPEITEALSVAWDRADPLVLEVHAHLDERNVRTIALHSTAGLSRGTPVHATGGPVTVPVGDAVLGRLLNVCGECQDNGVALPLTVPRWPIHREPPALQAQSAASEVFETGIKVIDLLAPIPQGERPPCLVVQAWVRRFC